ncbi:MAG: TonB-dependent receptor [Deltaproteobacteria bacterium]|nr:TonB-dependent receptor [Deltaproteobacteria bacterium]
MVALVVLAPAMTHAAQPITPPRALELPPAVLPEGTPMADHDVVLVLTIGVDGLVMAAELQTGVGEPWDAAALAAARAFRFEPARQGEQAIAVKVPFTYTFRAPRRRGRTIAERSERRDLEPAPGYVYAGEVVEKGTRTPLAGVPVVMRDDRTARLWEVLTDAEGRFVVYGLPRGRLLVDIFTGEFEPLVEPVRVTATDEATAREVARRFYLEPDGLAAYRTIVKEKRPPAAASVIDLTEDELTRVAGTFGDPTRVVASLPGVARSPFGLGYYVVRGANFDNTGFFIDGHPAVFLYHLLGGPGVVHPELVGSLSFYPGGYPAMYGRVGSSVIAVETKDPPRDRWHLDIELDAFKAGFVFSVPFDDDNGVATVSLRRSYYDLFLPLVTDAIDLAYTDYQARVSYRFSPTVRARFVALGAVDTLSTNEVATASGDGTSSTDIGLGFHRLNGAVEVDLSRGLTWKNSVAWEYDFIENRRVAEGDADIEASTDGFVLQWLSLLEWRPPSAKGKYKVDAGLDALYNRFVADLAIPASSPIGDPRPPSFEPVITQADLASPYFGVAPFVSADIELTPGLRLLPGVRLNLDVYADRIVPSLDPKLAVRWQVDPRWTLKAMGAMAHQPPQVFQIAEPFGDPTIPPVEGVQSSLGFEWTPADGWLVSVEGFYQWLDQLVRPADSLVNDQGEVERVYWDADLEARAFGLEVLIRKEFGDWIYGWLSYTLSRSERLRPPRDWGLAELDQTHILNLAWTVRLGDGWSLGARFQLASGNPYYPIVDARYDADQDRHIPIYAARSSRLPVYHRLDLRLDKTWRFEDWMFELFLDVQNVYNAMNPESPEYSYDFKQRADGLALPILPTLGVRAVF